MTIYSYGDPDDRMATELVRIADDSDPAHWLSQDQELVRLSGSRVLRRAEARTRALDVGAGTGRLVRDLLAVVDYVVAIEPDLERFDALQASIRSLPTDLGQRVSAEHAALRSVSDRDFDLILCSHVIQHLGTARRGEFLADMVSRGVPGGIGLVTYSSTGRDEDAWYVSQTDEGQFLTREVTTEEFETVAARLVPNALPVWHAGTASVASALSELGCTIVASAPYRWFNHQAEMLDGSLVKVPAADSYTLVGFPWPH